MFTLNSLNIFSACLSFYHLSGKSAWISKQIPASTVVFIPHVTLVHCRNLLALIFHHARHRNLQGLLEINPFLHLQGLPEINPNEWNFQRHILPHHTQAKQTLQLGAIWWLRKFPANTCRVLTLSSSFLLDLHQNSRHSYAALCDDQGRSLILSLHGSSVETLFEGTAKLIFRVMAFV